MLTARQFLSQSFKLHEKERSEREYWLELLIESGYYDDRVIPEQCIEMKRMLIASTNTAKASR